MWRSSAAAPPARCSPYRLAERGREVVVLERGLHVDPSQFTEDERRQFSNLYSDGGLQLSSDARFQVLQGMCVGGSTVVNNAVCFDLPDHVLDRWNDRDGLDAGLDAAELQRSFTRLRDWLPVISQADNERLGRGGLKLIDGIERLGIGQGPATTTSSARTSATTASVAATATSAARSASKLSALDTTLPRAQRDFGEDGVRILAECLVERVSGANGGSPALECRLSDGRPLKVSADTVVLASGALASSLILQRSGLGETDRGQLPELQHGCADDRRVRREARRLRRTPDLALPPPAARGRARDRELVQPGRVAGAVHAGVVLRPLPQHAPLRPHGLRRIGRRDAVGRLGPARVPRSRHAARVRAGRGRPAATARRAWS